MKKNFNQGVLRKIKERALRPRPRWEFLFKNYAIWAGAVLALLVAGLAFAVILHMFLNNDWDLYRQTGSGFLAFLFLIIPYVWLLFLAILIALVYYDLRHTKKGYRLTLSTIIAAAFLASVILGGLFYNLGLGGQIDDLCSERIPFYNALLQHRILLWHNPLNGLLAGVIIKVEGGDIFLLKDLGQTTWRVLGADAQKPTRLEIVPGLRVKILGEVIGQQEFKATAIRPLVGPGGPTMLHFLPPHR
ncbi:MAG: hypothetical protein COU85_00160 [Candidatus Portnoybacteria bacterium CG10_big_fil_rev_8_21_14_0_10_44_7]|uniref:Uncharacterized protein n=1 Tax=Candidatus Portnoybacteria bacterium CG10_big_fil_rev_8_21_14_0_10_44_7 TaxID=1974816 RepID=A0A2M8KJI7_9BACT|nr:MAG: hypothetical protein COU85_00160 [Candidatus Portnoybacteria bacterium CG10_big_fil_rev_8_21_14_0_10_44_7]